MLFEKIELEPGEKVLQVVRKHWFIIVTQLFGTALMILLPFVILFIVAVFPNSLHTTEINLAHYLKLITFMMASWSVLTIMAGFTTWTHYYLDLWIITERRIIVVDQIGFFNRNVSIFRLERLQDIEFSVKGVIPTLLNFGTIRAQTAGESEDNFKTGGLPDPRSLQATIQKAMDQRLATLYHNPDLA